MQRIIVILTALLCFYLPVKAAVPAPTVANTPPVQVPVAGSRHQGALFRITQAGHTLYLFGTIHVGRAEFFPLEPIVSDALRNASVLALELDPSRQDKVQTALLRYGIAPAGQSPLPPPLQTRRAALLQHYRMLPTALDMMQPWLQAAALTVAEFAVNGFDTANSVDGYLTQQFQKADNRRPVRGLETAESQLRLFGQLNTPEQLQFLDDTMHDLEDPASKQRTIAIVDLWRNADVHGLEVLLHEQEADDSFAARFTVDKLLRRRNHGLSDGIGTLLLDNQTSFAAIGILHLVGPEGVPALLRQRGFEIEQLY